MDASDHIHDLRDHDLRDRNVLVVIPVLNEEGAIASVIGELRSQGLHRIRVIDNGSRDRSPAVAQAAGAEVIVEPRRGYGQACWRGLQVLPLEIEWILFCDGDGSDDFSSLPHWLAQRHDYDLMLGDRRATVAGRQALTPVQRFGNALATGLIAWGWGYRYQDLGPLRLIRREALERIQMSDRGFGWTVEMQTRAVECGLRICELPTGYRSRQAGRSKISGTLRGSVQAGVIILATLGRLWIGRQQRQNSRWVGLSALFLLVGALWMSPHGDFLRQADAVPQFWVGAAMMGLGLSLAWAVSSVSGAVFWSVAVGARLALLPMHPGDDVWRYLWEGLVQAVGHSPYDLPPNAPELAFLRPEWWSQINHPGVTAIYPPVAQLGFRLLATIAPAVILFKLAFTAADLAILRMLARRFGRLATLSYAWNPLVIYAFAGGGHYDSWFLLPLAAAWLAWDDQRRPRLSALLVGLSIAMKWISLPVLGFMGWRSWRCQGWRSAIALLGLGLLPLTLTAIPFCSGVACPLIPTESVFVQYGRSAEFIPYWLGELWAYSRQHNWIYAIPLTGLCGVLMLRCRSILHFAEGYLMGLLLLSPIVHGWYFTWLIPFAAASRNLGTRLVSLSGFVYFWLPHRVALGDDSWFLPQSMRLWLWLPLIGGALWSRFTPSPSDPPLPPKSL